MATPLDRFYSPDIFEAGLWTQSHPSITGNAMHFLGSTQPDQKKKKKKETSASVWHQHASQLTSFSILQEPKNFKWLLNKDSPTKNNDVKPKPSFCGVETQNLQNSKFKMIYKTFWSESDVKWCLIGDRPGAINLNPLQQVMSLVRIDTLWRRFSLCLSSPRGFLSCISSLDCKALLLQRGW